MTILLRKVWQYPDESARSALFALAIAIPAGLRSDTPMSQTASM